MEEWIHTQKDQQGYEEQVDTVCGLYRQAQSLHARGIHVVSVDEKTGIQALERKVTTAMKPDQPARQDTEYTRHGRQCLIANLEIATGRVLSPTVKDTRKEEDFVEIFNFSSKLIKTKQKDSVIVMAGAAGMFPENKKFWKSALPKIKDHFDIAAIHLSLIHI